MRAELRARWRAHGEFKAYLERNPTVAGIYREETRRETVHVARRNAVLSLAAAVLSFGVSVANPVAAPTGVIALIQTENQLQNQASKIKKARGTTLERARELAKHDSSIEKPDIKHWLETGLVRPGDVPDYAYSKKRSDAYKRRKERRRAAAAAAADHAAAPTGSNRPASRASST
jgi:hypothetical protein